MDKLQRIICELTDIEQNADRESCIHRLDVRWKIVMTIAFLTVMLSIPTDRLLPLALTFLYPIGMSLLSKTGYPKLFRRSLIVLPFLVFVGIFGTWQSFIGILLRGMVSVQTVFLLVQTTGFHRLCRGLQRIGIPAFMANQLLFVYRYLFVMLQEALHMKQACTSRNYGRRSYPVKLWSTLVGQLFLRSLDRSERIHRAMLSRGFHGNKPLSHS